MTRARTLALAAILALPVLAVPVLAPVLAQVPIREVADRAGLTISGTVADVFGNKFVLQDDSGKVLVEAGPRWRQRLEVKPGDKVSVTGRPVEGTFHAFSITLADGKTIDVQPAEGPVRGPHAGGPQGPGMRGHGMMQGQGMMHGPGMMHGDGPGPRGRGPRHVMPGEEKSRSEILDLLRAAGYRDLEDVDRKHHHYEVEAINRYGQKVEVYVDFAGNIFRERRDD